MSDIHKPRVESLEPTVLEIGPFYSDSMNNSKWQDFKDSFKRAVPTEKDENVRSKSITKRHLRLMALSTGLGTGLLVAAGQKLRTAGPAGVLIAYFITGYIMLVPTINSVSELSIAYPGLPGGFQAYPSKFIDESWGFALGWNYAIQWMTVIWLELVTASMTIKFWNTSINPDAFVTIFLFVVILINFCGAKGYAEAEFFMNSIKVLMLAGFVIFGLIIDLGGGPQGFVGGRYYHDPGAFTSFKGLVSVFVTGAFSLGGSEFISLSAAETGGNVRAAIKSASKLIFFRVTVLFLGSLCMVGLLVPSTSDRLMGSGDAATHSSPYVIAAEMHGVKVLPHIINAVILVSVTSVATAAMYSSPRLIQSLAEQGLAPQWFNYIDRSGRPLRAWLVTVVTSFFSYIATYEKQETVFNWLLSISALSFIFIWLAIAICHLRFRAALKHNNIPLSSLAYVSPTGVIGSWLSIIVNSLILIGQFWVALWPVGGDGKPNAESFFENYLGMPFLLVCYVGHKVWTKNWKLWVKIEDIDVNGGRVIHDPEILELENFEVEERYRKAPFWKKALIVCFD
ncbi:high-affinity glutamine permease [Suhomyces tanzawaensis NRRL Y-17324]|uniref:High-affinity glutamine permease n=1 Tax=Suhomyces tanzawaensis NRRL Y-17324 TaxID=984487 RepID=A0A1E4SJK6_9ASCO|nr:high-affinity glutamine permease [Suhomyces tanzawaensis NRRL Y-17324]ODV79617.1 high-affinity glutamine permease [Suhomyces tanzawaensis NRRL Y-17324]